MASESSDSAPMSMVLRNIWCCTMIPMDRQTKSLWLPPEGICIAGERRGEVLRRVPSWQCTFGEWRRIHPSTKVLVPPHEQRNADERHGHAAEETLGRAQVSGAFAYHSIARPIDTQLPENELVLVVTVGAETRIFPLREVRRAGGIVHSMLAKTPVVVWTSPEEDSCFMGAYEALAEKGARRTFRRALDGALRDEETDSTWALTGEAIAGPSRGERLRPANFTFCRWHAWGWSHAANEVYRASPPFVAVTEVPPFDRVFAALRSAGFVVEGVERILAQQLPNEARVGMSGWVRGDRLSFLEFPNEAAAVDASRAFPQSVRLGVLVISSAPEERLLFRDSLQTQRIPVNEVRWSPLIRREDPGGADFLAVVERAFGGRDDAAPGLGVGLSEVVDRLEGAGHAIELGAELVIDGYRSGRWVTEITRRQLRPGATSGYLLRIGKEDFILYKFGSVAAAERYETEEPHSIRAGSFVLRSTPRRMYQLPVWGFGRLPDDQVPWSKLLGDEAFRRAFASAAEGIGPKAPRRRAGEEGARRYDPDTHVWTEPLHERTVRVGISSFGQREYGPFYGWVLPDAGSEVVRGQPMVTGLSLTGEHVLPAPVDGRVRLCNERLADTPELAQQDPEGEGWLLEIETSATDEPGAGSRSHGKRA